MTILWKATTIKKKLHELSELITHLFFLTTKNLYFIKNNGKKGIN